MVVDSHPCLTYLKNKRKMEIQILCFIFFISLIILLFEKKRLKVIVLFLDCRLV